VGTCGPSCVSSDQSSWPDLLPQHVVTSWMTGSGADRMDFMDNSERANGRVCSPPRVNTTSAPVEKMDIPADPMEALNKYNEIRQFIFVLKGSVSTVDVEMGEELEERLEQRRVELSHYIEDMSKKCVVFGDIETTELICGQTAIDEMKISVASLLFVSRDGDSTMLSFWDDYGSLMGAELSFFRHALNHAKLLVFYNGKFDLTVASGGDTGLFDYWSSKTHDPFKILRNEFPYKSGVCLKLDRILRDNELETKTASGVQAVDMFKRGEYAGLQDYNRNDVSALYNLVCLKQLKMSNGRVTIRAHLDVKSTF